MKSRIIPIQEGYLADDVTVKLKYDDILSHPNYPRLTEKYIGWVEENKDTVFLVWHNPNYSNRPDLVSLSKDGQKQIWLLTYFDIEEVKVPMCGICNKEPAINNSIECKVCREERLKAIDKTDALKEVFEDAFLSEESVTEELEDGAGL